MKMVAKQTIEPEFINQSNDFIKLMNENEGESKNGKMVFYDAESLIRNAFADNPQRGCELLFRRYHKILCSHAVRFVYSKTIAEDLVSEVFCRFWKNKTYLSVTTSYRMYLFRCVRNEALNHIRSEFKGLESIDAAYAKEISVGQRPDDITQFEEILQQVENLVESLTPQCRKVFLMNRFEGKKYHEIATELQLSQKTVEAHMGKALTIVRKGLQHHWLARVLILIMLNMD